jgi:hypothetical protein
VIGKAGSIRFNIPGDYGDSEYTVKKENNQLTGMSKSAFGNNGLLRM